jgi:AmiR/NasT family two-component response regulator
VAEDAVTGAERSLRILAADEDREALESTVAVLEGLGHDVTSLAVHVTEAAAHIVADEPDLAVVVVHQDDEHALSLIEEINEYSSGPVIAVLHGEDPEFVRDAAKRGVYAYARLETPEAVQGAIEVAMARHAEASKLSDKVDQLEGALDRRAIIERAKGILMERHGITEQQAFDKLRGASRASNRRVVDLARAITDTRSLLPDNGKSEPAATPGD